MGLFRREQQKEFARLTPRLAFLYENANLSTALRGKFVCYAKFTQINEREKFLEIHKSFYKSKLSVQNLCRWMRAYVIFHEKLLGEKVCFFFTKQ